MIVGTEWLIEAFDCDAEKLRDVSALQTVFSQIIKDLDLKTVGESNWHKFAGEGGITGLTMLTESHLACHTYPEHQTATFNLYCCKSRPEWNWRENLQKIVGAKSVNIQKIERGVLKANGKRQTAKVGNRKQEIGNHESKILNFESETLNLESAAGGKF